MPSREAPPPPASRADAAARRTRRSAAAPARAGRPRRRRCDRSPSNRRHEGIVTRRSRAANVGVQATEGPATCYSAPMRVRLDYGTDGLDVDLPDERITVIEPVPRPAVADVRRDADARRSARRSVARRCASRFARATRRHLGLRHHARPAAPRTAAGAVRRDAGHPAVGHHDLHRHRHASRRTPTPSSSGCSDADILSTCRVVNHDSRDAATLAFVGTHVNGRPGVPESRIPAGRHPHHHRIRRAAFLRRLQRRSEDGGARPGRSRDGDDAARRQPDRPSERDVGRHRGQPGA